MHHAVLPSSKFAFYAGLINVDSVETLSKTLDEFKWVLRTNGQGWSAPLTQNRNEIQLFLIV